MLTTLFLVFSFFVYLVIPVLLWLARRSEEREWLYERWAAGLGAVAGTATLATNLVLAFGPDIHGGSLVVLVLLAAIFPLLTLTGAVLTWLGTARGPFILILGVGLWLANMLLGFLGAMFS